jgi:hypothetical protein
MFAFIQAWSGQSGSGFVPHSPAPLALADALAPAPPGAMALPASPPAALSTGAADAAAVAIAEAIVGAEALVAAAGALDAAEALLAVIVGFWSAISDFVQATISAASERRTGSERMAGELTRNRI